MKYFVSHESQSIVEAVKLKELLSIYNRSHEIFLSSDWSSIATGSGWMDSIIRSLQEMDEIIVLITRKEAFSNLWINFEIGAAIGRRKNPKILVFGGVSLSDMSYPISGLHAISTGDTNRWVREFDMLGYKISDIKPFAELFRQ